MSVSFSSAGIMVKCCKKKNVGNYHSWFIPSPSMQATRPMQCGIWCPCKTNRMSYFRGSIQILIWCILKHTWHNPLKIPTEPGDWRRSGNEYCGFIFIYLGRWLNRPKMLEMGICKMLSASWVRFSGGYDNLNSLLICQNRFDK